MLRIRLSKDLKKKNILRKISQKKKLTTKLLKSISNYVKNLELLYKEQTKSLIKFKKSTKKEEEI